MDESNVGYPAPILRGSSMARRFAHEGMAYPATHLANAISGANLGREAVLQKISKIGAGCSYL